MSPATAVLLHRQTYNYNYVLQNDALAAPADALRTHLGTAAGSLPAGSGRKLPLDTPIRHDRKNEGTDLGQCSKGLASAGDAFRTGHLPEQRDLLSRGNAIPIPPSWHRDARTS